MKPKARVIVHRAPAPVVHRVPKRAVRPVPSRVHRAPSTPPRVAPRPQPSKSYGKAPGYKAPAKGDHKSHR